MEQPAHIKTLFRMAGRPFRFNEKAVLDRHAIVHFLGSAALCLVVGLAARWGGLARPDLLSLGLAFGLGVLWEVADGFKPLWYEDPHGDWRDLVLRADGFSWSDLWADLWGSLLGLMALQVGFGF